MARFAGRKGRVYLGILSTSALAEPLPFVASWTLNGTTQKFDVTAFGDTSKVYVAGLPDASGQFDGFMDDVSAVLYTIAQDGLSRKFYLYPNTDQLTSYFFGTVLADFSGAGAIGGAGTLSSTWNAATPIIRVG